MPTITVKNTGKTLEAAEGTSILQALLAAGENIAHKCEEGKTELCGACHLFVVEGRKSLSKIQRSENEMLDTLVGVGSGSRLACLAILGTENITIELLSA
ncbi:ferredoxin [Sulfuricella sp. T08]|uniref:2Fe-2S iron-sulfur cluster-binding protein n=1 Tax=Sulfuricella sp. T08 TaxID=1632857 RepID=UPI0006179654|nr:2Fe-2S iron-sulfur cluster binding domain-containing protein [Sulfuricella sp. T08]GAO37792.1 ferredoxin [Sulfuricella sp. T08]